MLQNAVRICTIVYSDIGATLRNFNQIILANLFCLLFSFHSNVDFICFGKNKTVELNGNRNSQNRTHLLPSVGQTINCVSQSKPGSWAILYFQIKAIYWLFKWGQQVDTYITFIPNLFVLLYKFSNARSLMILKQCVLYIKVPTKIPIFMKVHYIRHKFTLTVKCAFITAVNRNIFQYILLSNFLYLFFISEIMQVHEIDCHQIKTTYYVIYFLNYILQSCRNWNCYYQPVYTILGTQDNPICLDCSTFTFTILNSTRTYKQRQNLAFLGCSVICY